MNDMTMLKSRLCDELEMMSNYSIDEKTLSNMHMLTDTIKNIYKIEMLAERNPQRDVQEGLGRMLCNSNLSKADEEVVKMAMEIINA